MKKVSYFSASALMVATMVIAPFVSMAQVQATMPALYNQFGQQVNNQNVAPFAAGIYYLQPNQTGLVNYYGNGTYYDPSMGVYGGSAVNDPYGRAGVALGYVVSAGTTFTPTVPNTGAGGDASVNWMLFIVSGVAVVAGGIYLGYTSKNTKLSFAKLG
jgi:hypothetical protein